MSRIKHKQVTVRKCGIVKYRNKLTEEQKQEWGREQGILYKNPLKGHSTLIYPEGIFLDRLKQNKATHFKRHIAKSDNPWVSLIKSLYKLLGILNIKASPKKELSYTATTLYILKALYKDIDYDIYKSPSCSILLAYSLDDRFHKTKEHLECLDKMIATITHRNNKQS